MQYAPQTRAMLRILIIPPRPRHVISAINIPLSVMMGSVLACRLVRGFFSSLPHTYKPLLKVLDLRERGSKTVSESEGTAAFTSKSLQQDLPFTPPELTHKGHGRTRNEFNTFSSNIMLTTLEKVINDGGEVGQQCQMMWVEEGGIVKVKSQGG